MSLELISVIAAIFTAVGTVWLAVIAHHQIPLFITELRYSRYPHQQRIFLKLNRLAEKATHSFKSLEYSSSSTITRHIENWQQVANALESGLESEIKTYFHSKNTLRALRLFTSKMGKPVSSQNRYLASSLCIYMNGKDILYTEEAGQTFKAAPHVGVPSVEELKQWHYEFYVQTSAALDAFKALCDTVELELHGNT